MCFYEYLNFKSEIGQFWREQKKNKKIDEKLFFLRINTLSTFFLHFKQQQSLIYFKTRNFKPETTRFTLVSRDIENQT